MKKKPKVKIQRVSQGDSMKHQRFAALDIQIGGAHYTGMKVQPMEFSMRNGLNACQHTAIKYITRFREKGGIADLEKAKHTIDMLIGFAKEEGVK